MTEVEEAIAACVVARRWNELSLVMQKHAREIGVLDPARLFQGAITFGLVRYALTLTDPGRFDECLAALKGSAEAGRSGRSLESAIKELRTASEHRHALDAFNALGNADPIEEVH